MFQFKQQSKEQMKLLRLVLGFMCFFLPELSILPGFIAFAKNGSEFFYSISATFYATSNVHMIAALKITAIFFLCYKGYSWFDRVLTLIMALTANLIVDFPCLCQAATQIVGPWQVPVEISSMIHNISAAILFGSFWVMVRFGFTQSDKTKRMTAKKRIRNDIYMICSLFIMVGAASQVITSVIGVRWMTIINEAVMLKAFGIAWLVKSELFKHLND